MFFQRASTLVSSDRFTLSSATDRLVDAPGFHIDSGSRAALVGRNGSGKTTLLRVIAAIADRLPLPEHVHVDGGLHVARGTRVAWLPQVPDIASSHAPATDYIDRATSGVVRATADYERASARLEGDTSTAALDEMTRALGAMEAAGAWSMEGERDRILNELLAGLDIDRPLESLSGGEIARVALAGILLAAPDLVLLDEPTNNLDADALAFVSGWLARTDAALLVVSHDRVFLDATVTSVLAINEHTRELRRYGGTYSDYVEAERVEFAAQVRQYEEQEAQRRRLTADAARLDIAGKSFERTQNDYVRARGKKVARRAVVQRARIDRDLSRVAEPLKPQRPRIVVSDPADHGDELLLQLDNVAVDVGGRRVVDNVTLRIRACERHIITGANGAGKTTLLRVIAGDVDASSGEVRRAPHLRIAYLAQMPPEPRGSESVVEYARRCAPISHDAAGALLGKVLFDDVSRRSIAGLSVGERRRVELAVLFATAPHLLLLDEPTNHLDLPTIEMLEEALASWSGALVAVSHDLRFIEGLGATHRLEMRDGAAVTV